MTEEAFGWMKTTGPLDKLLHRGLAKVTAIFTFACAAYNLVRLRRLLADMNAVAAETLREVRP